MSGVTVAPVSLPGSGHGASPGFSPVGLIAMPGTVSEEEGALDKEVLVWRICW
jgi:hypothetical protein